LDIAFNKSCLYVIFRTFEEKVYRENEKSEIVSLYIK